MAKVLIVDDERGMRKTLEKFLSRSGYEVYTAESFEEAQNIIKNNNLDVVVSDILLNGPTGIDVLKYIREVSPQTKTIMITGHPELETTVQGMRLGAFDYLSKPISGKQLVEVVDEAARVKQSADKEKTILKKHEGYLRTLIDNMPLEFWSIDKNLTVLMQNSKSMETWGNKVGRSIEELNLDGSNIETLKEKCLETLEGKSAHFTLQQISDEEHIYFSHNLAPVTVDNEIVSIVGVSKNITGETKDKIELKRFASVLKSTSQGVILLDLEGNILNVNDAACSIYNISREEALGKNIFKFVPEPISSLGKSRFRKVINGEQGNSHEYKVTDNKGGEIYLEVLSTAILDDEKNIIGMSVLCQDISERKRTENALKESEELHKQLVNLLPEALVLADCDNRLTYVSTVFLELFGYESLEKVLGKSILEFLPEEYHSEITQTVESIYQDQSVENKVYPLIKEDGSYIWCSIEADIFRDKNGNVKGLIAVLHDLTERLRMENAIRNSEKRFRELAELLPEIVYEMDISGIITFVSDETYNITGYTKEDVEKGFSAASLFVEEDRERAMSNIKLMLVDPDLVTHEEYMAVRKDGSTFPVITRSTPIIRNGRIEGIRGIIFDLTEQKKTEAKQRELLKHLEQTRHLESLAQMAGGIAHDFNNLLTGILGNATLAKMDVEADNPAYENLHDIEQAAESATELVRKMLAYSGKGVFTFKAGDISQIVKQTMVSLHPPLSSMIKLDVSLDTNLPKSNVDKKQIRQLVTSLVTNASEAIEGSGKISIRTGYKFFDQSYLNKMYLTQILKEGKYIYLDVEDTGCGFKEKDYAKLFDPFYSTKFLGRGMGLAAVLGIVRGHGGAIFVVSEPDRGSLFRILFVPNKRTDGNYELNPDSQEKTEIHPTSPTILVADDEPLVLKLARKTLLREGFRVLLAKDGFEAVEIFEKQHKTISAVLLDLAMPRKNGSETFREIIAIDKNAKVILSSGYSEEETLRLFPKSQLKEFLHKPFKPEELIMKVRKILNN